MNVKTGWKLLVVFVLAGVQETLPPTEIPTAIPPDTPTVLPYATARPTTVPTVTPTPLSPDAQALKDIVFSDCIPVEESLPDGMDIPWNLLGMQDRIVYILNLEDGTKTEVSYFSGTTPEGLNKFTYDFFLPMGSGWLIKI